MTRRLVMTDWRRSECGERVAKVYRDSDTDEYVVKLYVNGCLESDATAFESFNRYDRVSKSQALEAARGTAAAMVRGE